MKLLIRKGRVLDPGNGRDGICDILLDKGLVAKIGRSLKPAGAKVLDAANRYVFPGLVDLHCHLREPGREDEETIVSGSGAAAAGGFTTICCMPNTEPPLDNKVAIRFVHDRAARAACEVLPIGCITVKREGTAIAPYGEMVAEGAVAFSDDGSCVMNSLVMRRALEYTKVFAKPVISHAEDAALARNGVMNEGALAVKLGLAGIPTQAEEIMVARDLRLAALTGGRLHIAHVTTAESVALIRAARRKLPGVSCEAAVHHFTLSEEAVTGYNANAKVSPPLRRAEDVAAVVAGLKDGAIDCIVTDHAPHSEEEKETGFDNAPFGMIGFETALALSWELVARGVPARTVIAALTVNPARVLGIERGRITEGQRADLVIFDPKAEWVYTREGIRSKSKNSPFIGRSLKGRVVATIRSGEFTHQAK